MALPLFESAPAVDVTGMVHHGDPHTSVEAAEAIAPRRTELHEQVRRAVAAHGPITDEDLERLPEFDGYGPSTIRKRRSELYQDGVIVSVGARTNSRNRRMLLWVVSSSGPVQAR